MYATYLAAFIPLFFAIDVIGILPLFLNMTSKMSEPVRRRTISLATITGLAIGAVFLFVGKAIFVFLGITISDFKIAGGLLLLVFSIQDLLFSSPSESRNSDTIMDPKVGVVPIGMPLIVGPGVLTTLLLSVDLNGYVPTLGALLANILIVWLAFRYSDKIIAVTGRGGAIAIGKVFSLLMGAIAVAMIRSGLTEIIQHINN